MIQDNSLPKRVNYRKVNQTPSYHNLSLVVTIIILGSMVSRVHCIRKCTYEEFASCFIKNIGDVDTDKLCVEGKRSLKCYKNLFIQCLLPMHSKFLFKEHTIAANFIKEVCKKPSPIDSTLVSSLECVMEISPLEDCLKRIKIPVTLIHNLITETDDREIDTKVIFEESKKIFLGICCYETILHKCMADKISKRCNGVKADRVAKILHVATVDVISSNCRVFKTQTGCNDGHVERLRLNNSLLFMQFVILILLFKIYSSI